MEVDTRQIILNMKCARIIELYAARYNVSLTEAMELFYTSQTCDMIYQGISDLHCMSDGYLATELFLEQQSPQKSNA